MKSASDKNLERLLRKVHNMKQPTTLHYRRPRASSDGGVGGVKGLFQLTASTDRLKLTCLYQEEDEKKEQEFDYSSLLSDCAYKFGYISATDLVNNLSLLKIMDSSSSSSSIDIICKFDVMLDIDLYNFNKTLSCFIMPVISDYLIDNKLIGHTSVKNICTLGELTLTFDDQYVVSSYSFYQWNHNGFVDIDIVGIERYSSDGNKEIIFDYDYIDVVTGFSPDGKISSLVIKHKPNFDGQILKYLTGAFTDIDIKTKIDDIPYYNDNNKIYDDATTIDENLVSILPIKVNCKYYVNDSIYDIEVTVESFYATPTSSVATEKLLLFEYEFLLYMDYSFENLYNCVIIKNDFTDLYKTYFGPFLVEQKDLTTVVVGRARGSSDTKDIAIVGLITKVFIEEVTLTCSDNGYVVLELTVVNNVYTWTHKFIVSSNSVVPPQTDTLIYFPLAYVQADSGSILKVVQLQHGIIHYPARFI